VSPVTSVSSPAPGSLGPTSTMSITIVRTPTTSSAKRRGIQTIPTTSLSVDAQVWEGSSTSGSPVATSCVAFPANATTATLSVASPQGQATIQIAAWSGTCSSSGGPGTTGTGAILSEFTGTGTVLASSTDIGTVFNSGNAIALVTPAGGTGTILVGPTTVTTGQGPAWGAPGVASAFNYPVQSGFDGTGMTVAIVIDSSVATSDLNAYLTAFSIPTTSRSITFESVDSANANAVTADQTEAALDLETIAGLAPGANIIVYVIPGLDDISIGDAYNQIITDGHANVVNSSFGGCEGVDTGESSIFATGTAAKIAFVASSGDQGSACYSGTPLYSPGVNYPASDPNVIGVGGTDTNTFESVPLTNPAVWNDLVAFGSGGAGGGGVSTEFTIPSYQQGVSGLASSANRNVPDIAGPAAYAALYVGGALSPIDGTSWSSPQFAAELSEIYQYCKTALTNPVSQLYTAYSRSSANFIDVTSGNNSYALTVPGAATYSALTGRDNVSGLGMPKGMNVAQSLCPGRVPSLAPVAQLNPAVLGPSAPVLVPLTTNVAAYGTDMGERATSDLTTVQFVLRNVSGIAANEQAVLAALTSAGFTITKTFSNHLVIDASAPNATVEGFLTTTVHNVNQGALGARIARVGSLTIPASVAPYAAGVTVGNLVRMKAGPVVAAR